MSKDHEFGDVYGCGEILCTCDQCGDEEVYEFYDGLDYRGAQEHITDKGWGSRLVDGTWYDFCCPECRIEFLKNNV